MPSTFANDEEGPKQEQAEEQQSETAANTGAEGILLSAPAEAGQPDTPPAQDAPPPAQGDAPQAMGDAPQHPEDKATWAEPQVQAQAIFTELYRSGGKTEAEMQQLLASFSTTMGWVDYWSLQGFLTQVVGNSGKSFQLSGRAVLELELWG